MKDHEQNRILWGKNGAFLIMGLGSLLWLILRSASNPRRLAYPCQRAALASSVGFLGYLATLMGTAALYRVFRRRRTLANLGFLAMSLLLTTVLAGRCHMGCR